MFEKIMLTKNFVNVAQQELSSFLTPISHHISLTFHSKGRFLIRQISIL